MSISKLRGGKTSLGQQKQKQQQNQQKVENSKSNESSPSNEAATASKVVNISTPAVAKCLGSAYAVAASNLQQESLQIQQQQYLNQQQQQQTYLPQTSLLKIKPFVPSLNARLRRPISRSYSTLSSTYLKRTLTNGVGGLWGHTAANKHQNESAIVGAAVDRSTALPKAVSRPVGGNLRRAPIKVITHQRSKSTSSSAASSSNRPATAAANGNHTAPKTPLTTSASTSNGGAILTPQPNGICRIARLPKEQEKLPDRINYDRRGLTAIPIFENESNLRLLSLQHNLINVFHIPKEEVVALSYSESPTVGEVQTQLDSKQQLQCSRPLSTQRNNSSLARMPLMLSSTATNIMDCQANTSCVTTNSGIHSPTPPPLHYQPLTAHPLAFASNGLKTQLLKRNNLLQHLNLNAPHVLTAQQHHQQQPQQLSNQQQQRRHHAHYRFAMKKSKSFISNSSRQANVTVTAATSSINNNFRRGAPKPLYNKTESKMLMLLGRTNLMSFDSSTSGLTNDSISSTLMTSEIEEEDCYEHQLEIKNRQLQPSYGITFQNLVFLDLYDNQIERIANLDGLPTLSVLLLGKNRITDIGGLVSLRGTLRVLDLHGNKITSISNKINCLHGLKSLNLAGNQIRQINQNDFNGLLNLKELNLKRNRIRRINGFQHLIALERLWLCHNDIHKVDDMSSIAKAVKLLEVTIENNPVSLAGDCVSFLVSYLPNLQSLSQMPITEQVRRAAMAWRKNKELSEANHSQHSADAFNSIRREEVISNARTNWELLRSQQTVQSALKQQRSPKQRELAKISESNETVVGYEELQEYIKLPPIQQKQNQQQEMAQNAIETTPQPPPQPLAVLNTGGHESDQDRGQLSGSSNSSLGPNVDSSSSSYSSDNEETPTKQCAEPMRKKKVQRPASLRTKAAEKMRNLSKESLRNDDSNGNNNGTDLTVVSNNNNSIKSKDGQLLDGKTVNNDLSTKANNKMAANGNSSSEVVNAQTHQQNANASVTLSRTPTPVTAMTANSGMLCLSYSNGKTTTTPTTESSPITSILIASAPAATSSLTSTTTTATTAATCKRYMRGSLMRSHVVVNGSIGGVGGRVKVANRTLNNQQQMGNVNAQQSVTNSVISIVTPVSGSNVAGTSVVTAKPTNSSSPAATTATSTTATTSSTNPTTSQATTGASPAPPTQQSQQAPIKPTALEREREQGGDYLIEICGRYLNIYGQGALRFIDKQWNSAKANDVHTLNFSYINFNNIAAVLARIKVRFPHAENFVFRETNISCLGQLNALAELQGIVSLFIDPEGNAVTTKDLWRQYAIYRLSHWGLKLLNGAEISATQVDEANVMYAGLSDLVLWSMPDVMLQPLLTRLRLDETCMASKMSPKEWLMKPENKSLRLVVGKEALQWKKPSSNAASSLSSMLPINSSGQHQYPQQQQQQHPQDDNHSHQHGLGTTITAALNGPHANALSTRERGKLHFALMMENTCDAVEKLHKLETLWPSLLLDIVRNTLLDYSQLDAYLRTLMGEIMK